MNKGNELVLLGSLKITMINFPANFIYSDAISSIMQKLYERPTVCLVLTGEEADCHLRSGRHGECDVPTLPAGAYEPELPARSHRTLDDSARSLRRLDTKCG